MQCWMRTSTQYLDRYQDKAVTTFINVKCVVSIYYCYFANTFRMAYNFAISLICAVSILHLDGCS